MKYPLLFILWCVMMALALVGLSLSTIGKLLANTAVLFADVGHWHIKLIHSIIAWGDKKFGA